jgi:hypothetical protein
MHEISGSRLPGRHRIATNIFAYVGGNPLNFADRTGNCPWCLGAIAGGVIGGGVNAISQLQGDGPFNVGSFLIATGAGAIAGGTGAWVSTVSTSIADALVMNAAINGVVGMGAGALDNAMQCKPYETDAGKNLLTNAILGAAGGVLGQGLANIGVKAQAWINLQRALAYEFPPRT